MRSPAAQITCARCILCLCSTFQLCMQVFLSSGLWLKSFAASITFTPAWFVAAASDLLAMLPRALGHQESEAERRAQLLRLAHLAYSARRVRLHHPGWHFLVQSVRESSRFLQYLVASSWQQLLATSTHVLTHLSIALFQ